MADLMPEEKEWLLGYCTESEENARVALKIGQLQMDLKKAIVSSFLKDLAESTGKELKDWKTGEITLWERGQKWSLHLPLTMEENQIELRFSYDGDDPKGWAIGVPDHCEACPERDLIAPYFTDTGLHLAPDHGLPAYGNRFWFYTEQAPRFGLDLARLLDEEFRRENMGYSTNLLVHTAKAITMALEE